MRRRPRRERTFEQEQRFIRRGYVVVYVLLAVATLLLAFSMLPLGR